MSVTVSPRTINKYMCETCHEINRGEGEGIEHDQGCPENNLYREKEPIEEYSHDEAKTVDNPYTR